MMTKKGRVFGVIYGLLLCFYILMYCFYIRIWYSFGHVVVFLFGTCNMFFIWTCSTLFFCVKAWTYVLIWFMIYDIIICW